MKSPWDNAKNILCVRLDSLGDLLMTTPAIRALKEARPDRKITVLTSPAARSIAQHIPEIDAIIEYSAPWMKNNRADVSESEDSQMIELLREKKFDAAVIFTVFSQNPLPAAMLCYWAQIPLRLAHCRENPYHLLTDWVPEKEPASFIRHEVQRQLDLVAAVGCHPSHSRLSFSISKSAQDKMMEDSHERGINLESPWIVIHPGASAASRRYPAESFAQVMRLLKNKLEVEIILTGDSSEKELVQHIRLLSGVRSFSLAGLLDVEQLGALISLSSVFIVNNTGPAHMAAALGTPMVNLYALTNPQHTPWQSPARVLSHEVECKNCFKSICPQEHNNCLRLISPEQVVEATLDLFHETQRNIPCTLSA